MSKLNNREYRSKAHETSIRRGKKKFAQPEILVVQKTKQTRKRKPRVSKTILETPFLNIWSN